MSATDEFSELLRCYGDLAYRMSLQLTGGRQDEAQDLVQEGFIKIWKFWQFQRPRSFKGWMYRVLHNLYMDRLRRKYHKSETSLDAANDAGENSLEDRLADSRMSAHEGLEQKETQSVVQKALSELDLDLRVPVVLCDMEGLSYEEIAKIVSCPIGTVRSRIHRGRLKLKTTLGHLRSEGEMRRQGDGAKSS